MEAPNGRHALQLLLLLRVVLLWMVVLHLPLLLELLHWPHTLWLLHHMQPLQNSNAAISQVTLVLCPRRSGVDTLHQ